MKIINRALYNTIFWISRIFGISIFFICLSTVLHAKYVLAEIYSIIIIPYILNYTDNLLRIFTNLLSNKGLNLKDSLDYFSIICKNSQWIDLLLIALVIILIASVIIIKFFNKERRYLLTISITGSAIYVAMYLIFKLSIMLALTISTPIVLIIIYFLNRVCPIKKVIMLIPIIGEICCTKTILKHISNNISDKAINIFLLLTALILSNTICFLFPYKTNRDFENRILSNWTYSIRNYQNKLIISGDEELIIIDDKGNDHHIENYEFVYGEDFIINKNEIYIHNFYAYRTLMLDLKTLKIINKIIVQKNKKTIDGARIYLNNDSSKLIVIFEFSTIACLVDLNTYNIRYIKGISEFRDGLIYNKYRNCFLVSFHNINSFFQEIDIENKKIRKIKADKYQGYIAMSKRNKEIYVAFHQQGRIGVYDAETMKLKRKIKSNYTVKDITYDEELNILIAPSYFTGYVDIFLMDGTDKLLTREFVGYKLREGCFDPQKENLYVCSMNGLYKKKINIRKLIEVNSKK